MPGDSRECPPLMMMLLWYCFFSCRPAVSSVDSSVILTVLSVLASGIFGQMKVACGRSSF